MTMYLEHFGLREAPFKITPHTEFFFAGAHRGETLEALIYAITSGEGIVKVTGEVGAGKTMLCRVLMERLPESVETIYFAVPSLSPDELLATVAGDLGVEMDGANITKLIRALQVRLIELYASGKRVVALIDEAHAMPVETLDQIRLLSNLETSHEKLIQIVLFGQPELDEHLSMPNIRQLKERITHSFYLLPLPAGDIKDYLNFRLRAAGYHGPDLFSTEALKLITEASEGLTRRINIYADKTLLAAFAGGTHTITTDHVRAAIADTQIVIRGQKFNPTKLGLAIAASLLLGAAIGFAVSQFSKSSPTSPPPFTANATANATADAALASRTTGQNETGQREAVISPTPSVTPGLKPVATAIPASIDNLNKPAQAESLSKRMAADMARIATLPKNRYAIQLMTADQRNDSAIDSYLRTAGRELSPELLMVFPTGSTANPRVSVLYGNYDGPSEAITGLGRLPAGVNKFRPYIRSFGAVQADARSATPLGSRQ